MALQTAEIFIEALNEIEKNKNFDQMLALYTDASEIGNAALSETLKGTDGAKEFWTDYRDSFETVSSTFRNKIVSENVVALEWTTKFNRENGEESHYHGVSMLEIEDGKIKRFHAYFNPQKLGEKLLEAAHGKEVQNGG